jgi:hypothetical protein
MAVVTQIQVRRGTASQWTSTNPVLAAGEWGYESDTNKAKIGNGSSAWNSLSYFGGTGTVSSITAGTGLSGGTITSTGTIAIDSTVATLTGSQVLTNKTLTAPIITLATNAQTATYTLALTDASDIVEMNVASANNLTIPLDSSVAFAIGTVITILQTGSGQTTINPTGGVTVNGTPGLKLRAQWSSCTLVKRATDTWVAMGDLSA